MSRSARVGLIALLITSWGCGSWLHSVEEAPSPPVTVADQFRHQLGIATSSVGHGRWWTTFDDGGLETVMKAAFAENLDLRRAVARLEQAKAVRQGANSAWYPQVDASGSVSRNQDVFPFGSFLNTQYSLSGVASYEIDFWGRIDFTTTAAALEFEATEYDLETVAMSVSAQVAETWFQLIEQRAILALLDHQIETNRTYLELVELRYGQGQANSLDVLQQRQQLAGSIAQRPLVEAQVAVLEHRLAVLLARSPSQPALPKTARLPTLSPPPDVGVPSRLVQQRPDVRAAQARVVAADNRIGAAIADQFPTIRLSATGGWRGFDDLSDFFQNYFWNLTAGLTAPLFDGLRRRAEVDRTKAVLKDQMLAYAQVVLTAFQEVEDALVQEQKQRARVRALDEQVDVARQTLVQARLRYANGLSDYLPVLTALTGLQQLEQSQVSAQRNLLSFRIQLYRALGGDWPAEIVSEVATAEGGEEHQ